jgi:predicted acylesterase/phospholipase RssA
MPEPCEAVEIGLVLQGGGALGAYEWGPIEALFAIMDELDRPERPACLQSVTGVSIGAINGACIVGATSRKDGLERLERFWNTVSIAAPVYPRVDFGWLGLPSFAPVRDLSLFALPGFYMPRSDFWNFWRWTSLYNMRPLRKTLEDFVGFDLIDKSPTTFVVTAVDLKDGVLLRFRNKEPRKTASTNRFERDCKIEPFEPAHIMASGSLAPQFPWTEIDGQFCWDGGIVDNTPLGDTMEAFSDREKIFRLVVIMNLYPLTAKEPANLLQVADRVHELSYGNRLRQDCRSAERINKLVGMIDDLQKVVEAAKLPLKPELRETLEDLHRYKQVTTIQIDLQAAGDAQLPEDDSDGLRDFSGQTVQRRRQRGRERAFAELIPLLNKHHLLSGFQPAVT